MPLPRSCSAIRRRVRTSQISVSTPLNLFTYYYGGYVQDDWRVSSKLTLNYGLRFEHEDGLREAEDRFTVGFDPAMSSALSSVTIPADPLAGTPARHDRRGTDVCRRGRQSNDAGKSRRR